MSFAVTKRVTSTGGLVMYTIAHYGGDRIGDGTVYRWASREDAWSAPFAAYEDAKSAAQADDEARVLSCLSPAPAEASEPTPASGEAEPGEAVAWRNHCDKTVPKALRFLAENDRPSGGEQDFNRAHLYQLAGEIEQMARRPLYTHPSADLARLREVTEATLAQMDQEMLKVAAKADRLQAENAELKKALRMIEINFGPDHGSAKIAANALARAARTEGGDTHG